MNDSTFSSPPPDVGFWKCRFDFDLFLLRAVGIESKSS
jgi:hypothetical protein